SMSRHPAMRREMAARVSPVAGYAAARGGQIGRGVAPAIEIAGWCCAEAGLGGQSPGSTATQASASAEALFRSPGFRGRSFVALGLPGADGWGGGRGHMWRGRNQDGAARSRARPRLEWVVGVGWGLGL